MDRIRAILAGLSTKEILAFVIALLIGLAAFSYAGQRIGAYIEQKKFDHERKTRLAEGQKALAAADAGTKRAELSEEKAAESEAVIQAKAKDATAKGQELQKQDEAIKDEIEKNYQADKARIDVDSDYCSRARDACTRGRALSIELSVCSECQ